MTCHGIESREPVRAAQPARISEQLAELQQESPWRAEPKSSDHTAPAKPSPSTPREAQSLSTWVRSLTATAQSPHRLTSDLATVAAASHRRHATLANPILDSPHAVRMTGWGLLWQRRRRRCGLHRGGQVPCCLRAHSRSLASSCGGGFLFCLINHSAPRAKDAASSPTRSGADPAATSIPRRIWFRPDELSTFLPPSPAIASPTRGAPISTESPGAPGTDVAWLDGWMAGWLDGWPMEA